MGKKKEKMGLFASGSYARQLKKDLKKMEGKPRRKRSRKSRYSFV